MSGIIERKRMSKPNFWDSWKGFIIRAIVLDGVYKKSEILKRTRLQEDQFELAFSELLQNELLKETRKDRFLVNSRDLCNEYRTYFGKLQDNLVDWVNQWRPRQKVRPKLNHFFLEDRLLYELSEKLIENANLEILVANPFVKRCHITETIKSKSKEGINVELITRNQNEEYLKQLSENGVSLIYDETVHAKLMVVDRCIGIVSSMNFYAGSSGGALWEAGLVTMEASTVTSIVNSILKKIES